MTPTGGSALLPLSAGLISEAIEWRQYLHRHPELGFNERQTADFIASRLQEFGLRVHRGLGTTGVVGTLQRGTGRKVIGIRADMDALRIVEQSGVTHASSSHGLMHACGHDGHMAIALAAARQCSTFPDLDGTVHFIFQPAEEGEGGARRMIEDGLFRLFPCDAIYALHNQPALRLGSCVVREGAMLAASARFEIEVSGQGCHGGKPHEGTDALLTSCHLTSSFQSIVSRNTDPHKAAVISVTQIRAGETFNVIPDRCFILGTTRWYDEDIGDLIERRMSELSGAIAAAFGCEASVRYTRIYPATINDPTAARLVRTIAAAVPGLTMMDHPPTTGSEDFSEMLQRVPGCYLWLGSGKSNKDPRLHSPHYDFNDELLPLGVALWTSLVRESLRSA